jgi:hypothetical protein
MSPCNSPTTNGWLHDHIFYKKKITIIENILLYKLFFCPIYKISEKCSCYYKIFLYIYYISKGKNVVIIAYIYNTF